MGQKFHGCQTWYRSSTELPSDFTIFFVLNTDLHAPFSFLPFHEFCSDWFY